jgi:hypothetical protein
MSSKVLFTERQKFNQWWIWLIMMGINVVFICIILMQYLNAQQINIGMAAGLGINSIMTVLTFFLLRLETEITDEGINVRFFPFHLSFIKIEWGKITKGYIREYSPLKEYGGWGIKYGFSGQGKAYNMSGNKGLQLIMKDGSRLLIGTNKPEALKQALKEAGHLHED